MKHSEYNRYFVQANSRVGIPIELMKSICQIESQWDHNFRSGDKLGLSGMKLEVAEAACKAIYGPGAIPTERDLLHAEENIMCLGAALRYLYNHPMNENSNMQEVVISYAKAMGSSIDGYAEKWWKAYQEFCDLKGEPYSITPNEVEGFYQRKSDRVRYL